MALDVVADAKDPQIFAPSIVEKFVVKSGKGHGPYFVIGSWGPIKSETRYGPGWDSYNKLQISETVCARLHPGFLHVPWYELSESCEDK